MKVERNRFIDKKGRDDNLKVPIVLDIIMLDCICKYILTDSSYIRKHHLLNLKNMIDIIDPLTYENDIEKVKRINFIKLGLECRLVKRIDYSMIIIQDISKSLGYEIDFIDVNNFNLTLDEIQWVTDTVSESLNYAFIFEHVDKMQDICTRFKATDYRFRGSIVHEFREMNKDITNSFRQAKVDSLSDMTFSLKEGKFEEAVTDTYNIVTSPSRRLLTGMQGFNEMTGGGLENERVYMLFGIAGVGKSMTLLNIIYQIKRINKNYVTKDPTKVPCIVLLTMENSVVETITRLFAMATDGDRMNNYTVEEVIHKLRVDGELVLNDDSPIDIVIKYKPNRSVDTSYLYTLVDDLEDEGYEVILLVQDHIKRIRSVFKQADVRLELGDIVNEFKAFAIEKDIPVLTDSHLNRDAVKILENISASGKNVDATKQLGKSAVGESFLMIDNLDFGFIINIDFDEQGNRYMGFNCIKRRDDGERDYIAQPFVHGSRIKLVEDFYSMIPLFKETLHQSTLYQGEGRKNVRNSSYSDIKELEYYNNNSKEDNLFEVPTKYNDMTVLRSGEEDEEEEFEYGFIPEVLGSPSQPIVESKPAIKFFININTEEKKNGIRTW